MMCYFSIRLCVWLVFADRHRSSDLTLRSTDCTIGCYCEVLEWSRSDNNGRREWKARQRRRERAIDWSVVWVWPDASYLSTSYSSPSAGPAAQQADRVFGNGALQHGSIYHSLTRLSQWLLSGDHSTSDQGHTDTTA